MTAVATRTVLAPPTLIERAVLSFARATERAVLARIEARQAPAERAATGYDPVVARREHVVDAYRQLR